MLLGIVLELKMMGFQNNAESISDTGYKHLFMFIWTVFFFFQEKYPDFVSLVADVLGLTGICITNTDTVLHYDNSYICIKTQ